MFGYLNKIAIFAACITKTYYMKRFVYILMREGVVVHAFSNAKKAYEYCRAMSNYKYSYSYFASTLKRRSSEVFASEQDGKYIVVSCIKKQIK